MRLVIQRAGGASVVSDGVPTGQIGRGLAVFVGISQGDTEAQADFLASKLLNLRIFEDDAGKMNLSVTDIGGELLVISNFTLFADCSHGNRPYFAAAMEPVEENGSLWIGVSAGGGALVVLIGALIWRSRKKKASEPAR